MPSASRPASLAAGASQELSLLSLASSASVELKRYRRAESLLPCGLTQDELNELVGRYGREGGIGGDLVVDARGAAGEQR